ncbi:MAG: RNB domain-containing ribonuclease, partial [Chthoniobacteraceae bacterium]
VSAFLEFNEQGKIKSTSFARTVIRSAARLTYRQAFAILENKPVPPTPNYERGGKVELSAKPVPLEVTPELITRVKTAWELASLLRKNRFAAGSLDLDFPEVKIWLDDQGHAERLEKVENDISHQLIEECMLAANEAVAREIKRRNQPAIYRVHDDPESDRLADFRETAASFGFRVGNLEQRSELQKLLRMIRGKPEEYAVKIGLLKSLKRAAYDTKPIGHYGLAKVNYTHFTSPIRRYADLIVHRVLEREKVGDVAALKNAAEHISRTERVSAEAEKDSTTLKKMEFFQRQLDSRNPEEFRAIVIDVRSHGLLIELPDLLQSGLIPVSSLGDDFFIFDATKLCFFGRKTKKRYQIGDQFPVIVSRVDAFRRQVDFAPA